MPQRSKVLSGVRILVVEDHPASARMVAALLTAAGAQVVTAETVESALSVLESFAARVVVVDVVLPSADGLTLVRRLKSDVQTRGIVCIAMSVVNGRDVEQEARGAGCAVYVRKPVDTDTFATLIAQHLEGTP